MFTSALYIITSMWKQHISNRWMDKEAVVHIHGSGLVAQLCPTLADPWTTRLLCPWDFPGKNTGVGSHFLLQGIFLTQESNTRLLCWGQCPALQAVSLPTESPGSWYGTHIYIKEYYSVIKRNAFQPVQETSQSDHMDQALSNSMKLWAMPCRAIQDRRVMVESSDKMWSTGEGNGKSLQYSCLENPMNSMKSKKIGH